VPAFRRPSTALKLSRVWADDALDEVRVAIEGPDTGFAAIAYVDRVDFRDVLEYLRRFAKQIYGGLCEVRFGEFGPEYANGAAHLRFHSIDGQIYIACRLQADFDKFGRKEVADEALVHLSTEPAHFDRLLVSLAPFVDRETHYVSLEPVPNPGFPVPT
jgi:hypothetical protein